MANQAFDSVMQDLQIHIKNANLSLGNLSTIAKSGDEKLVEKFLSETVFIQPLVGERRQFADNKKEVLQSQLYVACFWGLKDIVRDIIEIAEVHEIGININAKNPKSLWTPLHAATFQEHGPVIMYLLGKGADPHASDSEGRTPVDFASVSDKTWGHFAALNCQRTPKEKLIQMGLIKKDFAAGRNSPTASPHRGRREIQMASYSQPADLQQSDDKYSSAALGGDVLANDDYSMKQNSKPQFSIYKM